LKRTHAPILQNDVLAAPEIRAQFRSARDGDVVFALVVSGTWARRGNARRHGGEWPWRDEFLNAVAGRLGSTNRSRSWCGFLFFPLLFHFGMIG
jgi:hypothetical protein